MTEAKLRKLREACQAVRDFYQQHFDVMPVAFQTMDDLLAQALEQPAPKTNSKTGTFDLFMKRWNEMEACQERFAKFGAADTEPDAVKHWVLKEELSALEHGHERPVRPKTGEDWQLFTEFMNCTNAARSLTAHLDRLVDALRSCQDEELDKVSDWIKENCWR